MMTLDQARTAPIGDVLREIEERARCFEEGERRLTLKFVVVVLERQAALEARVEELEGTIRRMYVSGKIR